MKALFLIDGEHYIPVNRDGIAEVARRRGYEVLGAVFIGGTEKIGSLDDLKELGLPVVTDDDPIAAIAAAIRKFRPDVAVDLSDEPIVSAQKRFELANLILALGVIYEGADFRFSPPVYEKVCEKPSISIVGTGKRVGKTALGAYVARVLSGQENVEADYNPCIVTMGRGGPPEPEIIRGEDLEITPEYLLSESRSGKHAASDHYEDALMTRLTTIGCRRCGGGFAGVVFSSVVPDGARVANGLPSDFVIFEGSGASMPPVETDAWILAVGAGQSLAYINGYMGPYRIRKSDLCVLTMCEEPMADARKIAEMEAHIRELNPAIRILKTIFRPRPLEDITGEKVLFTTTAPDTVAASLRNHLQEQYSCEVVGISHHLSNRPKLRADIAEIIKKASPTVLLTELKAAAVDVSTAMGLEAGLRVVYADNAIMELEGEPEPASEMVKLAELAIERFNSSGQESGAKEVK
jgi:cyclic 2,3-diphosphoglycerate synthetase